MLNDKMQNVRVIWLDKAFRYMDSSQRVKIRLYHITSLLKTFYEVEECFNYVRHVIDDVQHVLLILSIDSFGENLDTIIKEAAHLLHVTFLYLLTSSNGDKELPKDHACAIFIDEDQLLNKLAEDIGWCNENTLRFNMMVRNRSTKDLSRQSAKCMWYQYLLEILLAMPNVHTATEDLLKFCRSNYATDPVELNKILEFEKTYCPEEVMKWYTSDAFLFRLVNQVLRQEDIDDMYNIRFILSDIHTKLIELHANYLETLLECNLYPYCLLVYRGQLMSAREFDQIKHNVGCLILMNSFLSTSTARDLSAIFSGEGKRRPQFESVLFEISIETSICETAFADIRHFSSIPYEEEILITIGAIFRIDSVCETNDIWIVRLTLCNQKSEGIKQLTDYFPDIKDEEPDLFTFAQCLFNMGDYRRAVRVYHKLLSITSQTDERLPVLWQNLAECLYLQRYKYLGEITNYFNISLDLVPIQLSSYPIRIEILTKMTDCLLVNERYHEAIEVLSQIDTLIDQDIAERGQQREHILQMSRCATMIGMACSKMEEHSSALEHFLFAQCIYFDHLPGGHETISDVHLYKSIVQSGSREETSESFESMQRSLELYAASLPADHSVVASAYGIIAWIYLRHHDIMNAQKAFEKSIELTSNAKSFNPIHIAYTFIGLGVIFASDEGLSYLDRAHGLFSEHLHPDNRKFIQLYISKAEIYLKKNEIERARSYLTDALKIELGLQQSKPGSGLTAIYTLFGMSHLKKGNYEIAMDFFQKSISLIKKFRPQANSEVAYNLYNLARVYLKQDNLESALVSFCQSLNIFSKIPLLHKSRLAILHNKIATVLTLQGSHDEAFAHLQNTLEYQLQYLSFQSEELFISYTNLALISKHLQDEAHFLEYYEKALDMIYHTNPNGNLKTADIHNEIGQFFEDNGEYTRALQSYELALKVNKQFLNEDHSLFLIVYNRLALIYSEIYEHEIALDYFQKALASDKQSEYHTILNINIGPEYFNLQQFEKAEIYLKEAVSVIENSISIEEENETSQLLYATALDSLARVKGCQDQYQEANRLCHRAFSLRSKDLLTSAVSYVTYGGLQNAQGNFDDALVCFHKAEIALKALNVHHPSLAKIYAFRTGSAYYNQKQFDKALHYYQMALELTLQVAPGNHKQIGRIRYGLDRIMDHILCVNQFDKQHTKHFWHCVIF